MKALPALLEISKKGGRCFRPEKELQALRPSFRAAVEEAQNIWRKSAITPISFLEFILARELAGEELERPKLHWAKDGSQSTCQLCTASFNLRNRRHHCRACGALCCEQCSTKRLLLTSTDYYAFKNSGADVSSANSEPAGAEGSGGGSSQSIKDSAGGASGAAGAAGTQSNWKRVCDACYNRLTHEASQPSPDHYRVKQLKRCALDVMHSMEDLIEALEDPEGDPGAFQASLRETMALTRGLDALVTTPGGGGGRRNIATAGADRPSFGGEGSSGQSVYGDAQVDSDSQGGVQPSSSAFGLLRSSFSFRNSAATASARNAPSLAPLSSRNSMMGPIPELYDNSTAAAAVAGRGNGGKGFGGRGSLTGGGTGNSPIRNGAAMVEALKLRESKLNMAENRIAKFLEVLLLLQLL